MKHTSDLFLNVSQPIERVSGSNHLDLQGDQLGLAIALSDLQMEDDRLDLVLWVTVCVPRAVDEAIDDMAAAVVLSVENSSLGQVGAINLSDPYIWLQSDRSVNYQPPDDVNPQSRITSWLQVPLAIEGLAPGTDEQLFFAAFLLDWSSNVLRVDMATLDIHEAGSP